MRYLSGDLGWWSATETRPMRRNRSLKIGADAKNRSGLSPDCKGASRGSVSRCKSSNNNGASANAPKLWSADISRTISPWRPIRKLRSTIWIVIAPIGVQKAAAAIRARSLKIFSCRAVFTS